MFSTTTGVTLTSNKGCYRYMSTTSTVLRAMCSPCVRNKSFSCVRVLKMLTVIDTLFSESVKPMTSVQACFGDRMMDDSGQLLQ